VCVCVVCACECVVCVYMCMCCVCVYVHIERRRRPHNAFTEFIVCVRERQRESVRACRICVLGVGVCMCVMSAIEAHSLRGICYVCEKGRESVCVCVVCVCVCACIYMLSAVETHKMSS